MITTSKERVQITATERFAILARDNFTCQACGARPGNPLLHVDHLLPWSRGGSNHPSNLTALCKGCNLGKSSRVWIPPALLHDPKIDDDGFQVWKKFGTWNIEVCESGVIANWPKGHGHRWFGIERCRENWGDHFQDKAACVGCDADCDVEQELREFHRTRPKSCNCGSGLGALCHSIACSYFDYKSPSWFHLQGDLGDVLSFMRTIYRP